MRDEIRQALLAKYEGRVPIVGQQKVMCVCAYKELNCHCDDPKFENVVKILTDMNQRERTANVRAAVKELENYRFIVKVKGYLSQGESAACSYPLVIWSANKERIRRMRKGFDA